MNPHRDRRRPESRNSMARKRTSLALQRTAQANERTFNAWVRTGLSTNVAGLGIVRLIDATRFQPVVKILGILMVASAVMFYLIGMFSYWNTLRRLEKDKISVKPNWVFYLIFVALLVGSGMSLILILRYHN